ncbi:protein tyrosine phosphatase family protein [Aliiglaciecola litoralis]|uniref:Protein tyrosine phosphatase family protein n=1 Tax=Aliiglaciecola litoralis TaxID=582857 RepID=A0ABN1LCI2_9ALTE
MKNTLFQFLAGCFFTAISLSTQASDTVEHSPLADLKNYQVNTARMVSSGLPNRQHFETLKSQGVTHVIDLIPGDRADEIAMMEALGLGYHNVQVDWENPTLANFDDYVLSMQQSLSKDGKTLTHCRLNWRGAVFTYLYRVTQLNESEQSARQDMLAIWQPNETWQAFIDQVKAKYQQH